MSNKKAYSYIRMSTEHQLQGDSLRRQLSMSEAYAKEKKLDLIEDMRDIGLSAYTEANVKKGEFGRFINAVNKGEVEKGSILLVESLDRLSRAGIIEAFGVFLSLITSDIEIHIISKRLIFSKDSITNNPYLLNDVMNSYLSANSESAEKARRLSESWSSKRENIDRKILTKKAPFWLKAKDDETGFDLLPEYADVVKEIFNLYINKEMGSFRITKHLNNDHTKYPPPPEAKNGWGKSTIQKVLNNPAVHGEFTPHILQNGKRIPTEDVLSDYFPSVISENTFKIAKVKCKERIIAGGGRKGFFSNIFTKKLVCGHCGSRINFQRKSKQNNKERYLRCVKSVFTSECDAPSWLYDDFKESFFKFSTEFEFKEMLENTSIKAKKIELVEQKQKLEIEIEEADNNFNRTLTVLSSLDSKVLERAKKQLNQEQANIDKLELKLSQVNEDLIKLERNNDHRLTDELQQLLNSHTNGDIDSSSDIREKITSQISQIVDEIVIFNRTSTYDKTSSLEENLSPIVVNEILKSTERNEVESYLLSNSDDKVNKLERYYKIRFKNGFEKIVHPYCDKSYKFDSTRMNKMIFSAMSNDSVQSKSKDTPVPKYKRKKRS